MVSWRHRLEVFPGLDNRAPDRTAWYVRLRDDNGQILMVSEAYTRRWSARRAANRMGDAFSLSVIEVGE